MTRYRSAMRVLPVLALCLGCGAAGEGRSAERPLDEFLFIGQSNMVGHAPFENTASEFESFPGVLLLGPAGWEPARNLDAGAGDRRGFNRYSTVEKQNKAQLYNGGIQFARRLSVVAAAGPRIGLIFNARGATHVAEWQKDAAKLEAGWDGNMFQSAVARAQAGRSSGGRLKAVFIVLGESDALDSTPTATYLDGLGAMIADFRAAVGAPDLPFFVSQLPPMRTEDYARDPNPARREVPARVSAYNAALVAWAAEAGNHDIRVIRSTGTGILSHVHPDSTHWDHDAQTLMGDRFGRAALSVIYHRPLDAIEEPFAEPALPN